MKVWYEMNATVNASTNKKTGYNFEKIISVLLGTNIFYQVFYNSAWRTVYTAVFWKEIGYGLLLLLMVVTFFCYAGIKFKLTRFIYSIFLLILIIISVKYGNLAVAMIPMFALSAYFIDFKKLIFTYFISTFFSVLFVAILSIVKLLPYSDSIKGYIVFGFKNPNTIGFYIAIMAIEVIILYFNKRRMGTLVYYLISLLLDLKLFHDSTAVMTLLIFILLFAVYKIKESFLYSRIVKLISAFLPVSLSVISFEIAKKYDYSAFFLKINDLLTNRAFLWHYYFVNFPPKLFMQNVNLVTYGFEVIPGNGAFDGAYISFLVYNGFILLVFFIVLLTVLLLKTLNYKQGLLYIFAVAIILSGFTEGLLFSAFQSPIIVIAMLVIDKEWGGEGTCRKNKFC